MTDEGGLRKLMRTCGSTVTRSLSNLLPSNPHADESDIMASSVEWLHSRVEYLLSPPSTEVVDQYNAADTCGVRSRRSLRRSGVVSSFRRSTSPQARNSEAAQKRRSQCQRLLQQVLKRLQSASRDPDTAVRLLSDDTLCRLLPMVISANFDMPPACELLLAIALANLSSQQQFSAQYADNNCVCNLVDTWTGSPWLPLSLCGQKIAANLSTYALFASLRTETGVRPYCIYHPDVYELAKPFLVAPLIDVVFVNGMLGSVFYTWKQSGDDACEGLTECWPRDWLGEDLPRARVLALNMKIQLIKCRGCTERDPNVCLPRRANEALAQLLAAGVGNRITAFVCHSFGGLVVKQILQVLQGSSDDPVRKRFLASVRGVVFIAVPHLGRSKAVNVNRCYWRPLRRLCLSDEARNVFDRSCRVLGNLQAWFVQFAQTRTDLRVLNLIELAMTRVGVACARVCPEGWVDKLVGDVVRIDTDHINICKPASRQSVAYTAVLQFLSVLSSITEGWRPSLLAAVPLTPSAGVWQRPSRNMEEELRLRYGVSSARVIWTRSAWHKFGNRKRPRFYDLL